MTADALEIVTLDTAGDTPHILPDFLIDDGDWLGDASALRGIVLPNQDEGRAKGLLEMGTPCVYMGDAVLLDAELIARLADTYGNSSVGVFVPATRMEVSWTMDTQSNADFKTVVPSLCEPAWEVLQADGRRTGTLVQWWLDEMFKRGAGSAIVQVDIRDDADLNLCATLVDVFGDRLYFTPASLDGNRLDEWVRWGQVRRLAVPISQRSGISELLRLNTATAGEAQT